MIKTTRLAILFAVLLQPALASDPLDLDAYERLEGFVDLYWDEDGGRLLVEVESLDAPMIYQSSLARGVGSNDLGLDRGQLGNERIVRFLKSGPKVLLVQDNLGYRAQSDDAEEKMAVDESFARSVIFGFEDIDPSERIIVDATPFFVRDAHGIANRLAAANEGNYSVDESRSAVYLPRTRAFPDNTEAEAVVTLTGQPAGPHVPSVVPDPESITVHVHHSFIRLPEEGYKPLKFDPRSGVMGLHYDRRGFNDYASAIGDEAAVDFGRRHRLEKKDPLAEVSEAVEPIVYYLDRGVPEPIRSALLDGARWWGQAFQAAGYMNAYRVELLPEDADPMDVRYNVIQWVHRSTRGWSYGDSIMDPRTGEILKGHVSLGSLRVRQDYLIAEGLLSPYADETVPPAMLEMALARIRQLSAHEVGHTLGFEHNFAASTQDRSSVMDYPAPLVRILEDNTLDLSEAYDNKIGAWDKRVVIYAYQDFPPDVDEDAARTAILEETIAAGFKYVGDSDSRSIATAHPDGNLWDNGVDAIAELEHLMEVRSIALGNFPTRSVRVGRPLATVEEVLVPIYLLHRFQIKAVGKLIGGQYFHYNLRGDGQPSPSPVEANRQQQAIAVLLKTLEPEFLDLPESVVNAIAPRPPNYPKTRETFAGQTGITFDAKAPAASAAALTLSILLEPSRAARMMQSGQVGFAAVTDALVDATWFARPEAGVRGAIQRQTNLQVLYALLTLAFDASADGDVRAIALAAVHSLEDALDRQSSRNRTLDAHYRFAEAEIERLLDDPSGLEQLVPVTIPPGSPIGSFGGLVN